MIDAIAGPRRDVPAQKATIASATPGSSTSAKRSTHVTTETMRIEYGVSGPMGQPGILLVAPRLEALEWDLEHEISDRSRCWMEDRQGWWIARCYSATLREILRRFQSL